jgi:hypothetical protein
MHRLYPVGRGGEGQIPEKEQDRESVCAREMEKESERESGRSCMICSYFAKFYLAINTRTRVDFTSGSRDLKSKIVIPSCCPASIVCDHGSSRPKHCKQLTNLKQSDKQWQGCEGSRIDQR